MLFSMLLAVLSSPFYSSSSLLAACGVFSADGCFGAVFSVAMMCSACIASFTCVWLNPVQAVKKQDDSELLVLDTDNALFADEDFRPFAEKYAADQDAFFSDYVKAHLKLSELGVEWETEPITLE